MSFRIVLFVLTPYRKLMPDIAGYEHLTEPDPAHAMLLPVVLGALGRGAVDRRVFELGCGNGAFAEGLERLGWVVTGVDPSTSGIAYANACRPKLDLHEGSAYDDLAGRFGRFPYVISLEVVEHVYAPREYVRTLFDLTAPGGTIVVSTPYHGYTKNLALAITGALDRHFTALWDHGHIKFWSIATLTELLTAAGFVNLHFRRVGRIPLLAKSMVVTATRPG